MNSILAFVLIAGAPDVAEARATRVYNTPKGMTHAEWLAARAAREARNAARLAALSEKATVQVDTGGKSDTPPPAVVVAPTTAPSVEPTTPREPNMFAQPRAEPVPQSNTNKMVLGGLLLVSLGAAALLVSKRKTKAVPAATFEVIATHAVAPKQKLQVIEVAGQRLLMSVTDKGIALLCALPRDTTGASATVPAATVPAAKTTASSLPADDDFEDVLAHAFADVLPQSAQGSSSVAMEERAATTRTPQRISEEVAGIARLRQQTPAQRLQALRNAA